MYWGNSSASDGQNSPIVFSPGNGFAGTWHLNSEPFTDASGRGFTGTNTASIAGKGVIGAGRHFVAGQYVTLGSVLPYAPGSYTLSTWMNADLRAPTFKHLLGANTYPRLQWGAWSTNYFHLAAGTQDTAWLDAQSGPYNDTLNWHYVTGVYKNGQKDTVVLYVDGVQTALTSAASTAAQFTTSAVAYYLGGAAGDFDGYMDEARIEGTARSADWIKLCYETQRPTANFTTMDSPYLEPLTIRHKIGTGTADVCSVWTDRWSVVFDEAKGGDIVWLSDTSKALKTNQITTGKSLFYTLWGAAGAGNSDTTYKKTSGVLSLLDSNRLFVKVRQSVTLKSMPVVNEYTIYGNGKMFVHSSMVNNGAADSTKYVGFYAHRTKSGTSNIRPQSGDGTVASYVHIGDDGIRAHDLLLSPFENMGTGWVVSDTSRAVSRAGYLNTAYIFKKNRTVSWNFMLEFGNRHWNDTSIVTTLHANDYRTYDSLEFVSGTPLYEKSWEEMLKAHWKFDEGSGDTAYDNSAQQNRAWLSYNGGWKAGGGPLSGYDSLRGTDSITSVSATGFDGLFQFTVMGWFKPAAAITGATVLFGKHDGTNGYKFTGSSSGVLKWVLGATADSGYTPLGTGAWHHVALVVDRINRQQRLYIDGIVDKEFSANIGVVANAVKPIIGKSFTGTVDDVRYYEKILPDEAVKLIAKKGFRGEMGAYATRADNNQTVHVKLDGSPVARYQPIFQVGNYWSNTNNLKVYVDGGKQSADTEYIATVNNVWHTLTLGFNKTIRNAGAYIYIDDNDSSGAFRTQRMPEMYWNKNTIGTVDYLQVKNTAGTTFGQPEDNQFYFAWKMDSSTNSNDYEVWRILPCQLLIHRPPEHCFLRWEVIAEQFLVIYMPV
jgi:hypothetical protein